MVKTIRTFIRFLFLTIVCIGINSLAPAQNLGTYVVTRTQIPYWGNGHYQSIWYQDTMSWNCSANTDNSISLPKLIGFDFLYNGMTCKSFYVSSNGFLVLDTLSTNSSLNAHPTPRYTSISNPGCNVATTNNYAYNDSCSAFYQNSSNNFTAMAVAPFYNDLITYYNGSYPLNSWMIHSQVSGTSPNRVLTVEWYFMQLKGYTFQWWNWSWNLSYLCFQTKMYETTGTIEFWYAFNYAYNLVNNTWFGDLPNAYKYVIGLSSNAYTPTLPNTNYVLTDSVHGTNLFSGNINFQTANPYPDLYYHKLTFSRAGADIAITTMYPPNPDTCTYSTAQLIVDTLVNMGSQNLVFDNAHPLKVYTQITGAISVLDSGTYIGSFPTGGTIAVQMANTVNMSGGGTYYLKSYTNSDITDNTATYPDQNVQNDTANSTYYNGSVTASAARTTICNGDTTQLNATSTTFGHLAQIAYSVPSLSSPNIPSPWTSTTLPDDGISNNISLGFTFTYFGRARTYCYISSNGNIQFSSAYNTSNDQQFPIPILPTDIIALAWGELKANYAGVIQYQTIGTAPNREFVLQFNGIADTSTSVTLTATLILHETSNIIEFQNGTIPSKNYIQGIEDSTGTINYGLGARNAGTWSATNDAYLLVSQANYKWSPTTSLSNPYIANPIASPTVTTTYTVTMNGGNPGYPDSTGVCPKTSTVTVNVSPGLGSLSSIIGDTILCSNMNTSYKIPPVTNATSYQWDNSGLSGSVITTGQGTDSITVTLGSVSGILKVRAYYAGCNIYSAWKTIYIDIMPNIFGPGQWVGGVSTDWFNPLNWCAGLPSSTVSAYIDANYYVPLYFPVINASGAVCFDMDISGYGESLTINSNYNLDVYGSWFNGLYNNNSTFVANSSTVTFKGSSSLEYINGQTPTTFNNITLNKGSSVADVLDNVQGETISMTGNLTLINGLFMLEEPTSTIQFTGSSPTIPATAGIEFDGGVLAIGTYSLTNYGTFRMGNNSSDITFGTATDNILTTTGATGLVEIYGGNLNLASQMVIANGAQYNFDDSYSGTYPNTVTLNTTGTSNNTKAVFDIDASSTMYITSGTMLFHKMNSGTGKDVRITSGATKSIVGGAFQFGDGTTPASQTFKVIDSLVDFFDIYINSYHNPVVRLDAKATVDDNLNLTHGVLNLNHNTLTILNSANNAITNSTSSPAGHILSEDTANLAAVKWLIPQNWQAFTFPFGTKYGSYIPFVFTNTGGPNDTVKVATYAPYTDSIAHKPYPPTVTHIRSSIPNYVNDSANIVNRFWQIDVTPQSAGTNTATILFTYGPNETHNTYTGMVGQRWSATNAGWVSPNANGGQSSNMTNRTVTVTGVTHFSPWTLANASAPLPIELLSFNAINEGNKYVQTTWVTASELNNDHFEIERSRDGISFDYFGKVSGAGNSNQILNYTLNDPSPYMGLSYYRLRQVDFDGKYSFSDIVPVEFNSTQAVSIYPNPNDGNFTISYNISSKINTQDNASLVIVDITGRVVYSYSLTAMKGSETIDASLLNTGIYYWELITGNSVFDKGKIAIMK